MTAATFDNNSEAFLPITAENIGSFVPIFVEAFSAPPWEARWSLSAAQERLVTFVEYPRFQGLGVLVGTAPAGLVLGWGERWSSAWVFHIKEMCVGIAHRNRGVGKRLLRRFEVALAVNKYRSIYLETAAQSSAYEFYRACGYESLDLISLQKRLPPGDQ